MSTMENVCGPWPVPDPNPWLWLMFHVAMTDDEVTAIISPYEPRLLQREDGHGTVGFYGSRDEEDRMRDEFDAWSADYEARNAKPYVPFDHIAYLKSLGIDPDTPLEIPGIRFNRVTGEKESMVFRVKA